MYYFGARYYEPGRGLWITVDPAFSAYLPSAKSGRSLAQDLPGRGGVLHTKNISLYAYAHMSPFGLTDSNGLWVTRPASGRLAEAIDRAIATDPRVRAAYREMERSSIHFVFEEGRIPYNPFTGEWAVAKVMPVAGRQSGCSSESRETDFHIRVDYAQYADLAQRPGGGRLSMEEFLAHEISHADDALAGRYGANEKAEETKAYRWQFWYRVNAGYNGDVSNVPTEYLER